MKRIIVSLMLVALLALAVSAQAFEQGQEVEVCNADGQYSLLAPEAECGGTVETGKVAEVLEGQIVVELPDGQKVTLAVE